MSISELPPRSIFRENLGLVEEIKRQGEKPMSPRETLSAFGIKIRKDKARELGQVISEADNTLIFESRGLPRFRAQDIERFLFIAQIFAIDIIIRAGSKTRLKQFGFTGLDRPDSRTIS
jgi:hypothetical protein